MSTWFIRHWPPKRTLKNISPVENQKVQEMLIEKSEIAVHYEDICSVNFRKYLPENQKFIRRFRELVDNGGFVCADYPAIQRMRVGIVEKESELLCEEGFHFIKRLPLKKSKEVSHGMRIRLLAGAPRGGTLSRWHVIDDRIDHLVQGKVEKGWSWLLPYEQETVCQEFLRRKFDLRYLLLPFGRALEDVDIYGISKEGKKIYAQVTHEEKREKLEKKVRVLAKYEGIRVFFCPDTKVSRELQRQYRDDVKFAWTNTTVWKWLDADRNNQYRDRLFSEV